TSPGEIEGRGREVERPFESESTAAGDGVGLTRRDRSVLEEEDPFHGAAGGGGERARRPAADPDGLVREVAAPRVVERDPGAHHGAAAALRQGPSVQDVEAGHEG